MGYTIVESQPLKPTRAYRKLIDFEIYKDFILQKHEAGMRQKAIRAALKKEKGVDLVPHNLKRLLAKWEASHKSLTKKRKLFIRISIEKRRQQNKRDPIVTLRRSNRVLTDEEVRKIMNEDPKYFLEIEPSPGDLILTTPTADADSADGTASVGESASRARESASSVGESLSTDSVRSTQSSETDSAEIDSKETHIPDTSSPRDDKISDMYNPASALKQTDGDPTEGEETIENMEAVIKREVEALKLPNTPSTELLDEDDLESVPKTSDARGEPTNKGSGPEQRLSDWNSPVLHKYRSMFEKEHEDYVMDWKVFAFESMMVTLGAFLEGISMEALLKNVKMYQEEKFGLSLPHAACRSIVKKKYLNSSTKDSNYLIKIESIQTLILELIEDSNSSSQNNGPGDQDFSERFKTSILHLPQILRNHGLGSFLTAMCLKDIADELISHGKEIKAILPLAKLALAIFSTIDMGDEIKVWFDDNFGYGRHVKQNSSILNSQVSRYRRRFWRLRRRIVTGGKDFTWKPLKSSNPERNAGRRLSLILSRGTEDPGVFSWSNDDSPQGAPESEKIDTPDGESKFDSWTLEHEDPDPEQAISYMKKKMAMGQFLLAVKQTSEGTTYYSINSYTKSIEALIKAYGMFAAIQDLSWNLKGFLVNVLEIIVTVADARGPMLYLSLQPVIVDCLRHISGPGKINAEGQLCFHRIVAKFKNMRNRVIWEECSKMLETDQASASDLTGYWYQQSLESGMFGQGIYEIPGDTRFSGEITDLDFNELLSEDDSVQGYCTY